MHRMEVEMYRGLDQWGRGVKRRIKGGNGGKYAHTAIVHQMIAYTLEVCVQNMSTGISSFSDRVVAHRQQ
jgi:hypothetical protein